MKGYKAFNGNLTNRYGKEFKEGEIYSVEGPLKFGIEGNGIHFCRRLEDTLRYVPAMEEEVDIAEVTSLGEVVESYDEYYGYYDLYAARTIKIDKVLSRNEIIKMYLNKDTESVIRFVSGYRLTPEEIEMFKIRYCDEERIIKAIMYYQENDKTVYNNKCKVKKGDL